MGWGTSFSAALFRGRLGSRRQPEVCFYLKRAAVVSIVALLAPPLAAQVISLPADPGYKRPKGSTARPVTLKGETDAVPMFGAQVVLRTPDFGQVTVSPQSNFADPELRQLAAWRERRATLQVQGTLLTMCSKTELAKGIMGCRVMDRSKPITLRLADE